jgi:hypothetical protein
MRTFACPVCRHLVTFESSSCLNCASELAFAPDDGRMMVPGEESPRCANAMALACNWLAGEHDGVCASCALTRASAGEPEALVEAEAAKRRLLYQLGDLRLPIVGWRERDGGLAFDFLSSSSSDGSGGSVTTGHADGVITLDLEETDPAHRERMRTRFAEPYRTVLGHLRHEIGHYYQPLLIPPDSPREQRCRALFGDERNDYSAAMEHYYAHGAPDGWEQRFVSAYATMHPWEDWAETFAHHLHIRDTLQTAAAYGLQVAGPPIETADPAPLDARPDEGEGEIHDALRTWIPLTYALNAINRSMGLRDLYPFVLSVEIEAKLAFVSQAIEQSVAPSPA